MHNNTKSGYFDPDLSEPHVATRKYTRGKEWRKLIFSRLTPQIVIYSTPRGERGTSQQAAIRAMRMLEKNWARV